MPCLCPFMLPMSQFGSRGSGECLLLPHCQLMATAFLSVACRGTTHRAAVSRAEQSDHVCPFTKADLSVVPSVLQRHKTQRSLWKRQRICSGSVEKMGVKVRCWGLLGAWITPEQTKYNKINTWSSKHKKENCLQVGENTTFIGFFSCIFPTAFHTCGHFLPVILFRRADPEGISQLRNAVTVQEPITPHPAMPVRGSGPSWLMRSPRHLGVTLATPA